MEKEFINKGRFKVGHIPWNKEKKAPQISKGKKGIKFTEEHKNNLSESWDYEKHITLKRNRAVSEGLKKAYLNGIRTPWNKNIPCSEETKRKMSKKMEGHPNFNTELKGCFQKGHPGMSRENNPNWNDGSSFEPYDINWTPKFRRAIRKRDNQICMLCRIHREKLYRALDVHHINYNKKMSIPQNCISLCVKCHNGIVHANKKKLGYWKTFFQSLLSKEYDYQYAKTGEIIFELK